MAAFLGDPSEPRGSLSEFMSPLYPSDNVRDCEPSLDRYARIQAVLGHPRILVSMYMSAILGFRSAYNLCITLWSK